MKKLSIIRFLSTFIFSTILFATQYGVTVEVFTETW